MRPLIVGSDTLFLEIMRIYETRRINMQTTGPAPWLPTCAEFPLVRYGQPGLSLEHVCEGEQIVEMPPFLVVDSAVFDLNPAQNVHRRSEKRFAPYWIVGAILVHFEHQVPAHGYREAHAIEAYSALVQHNEFGSVKAGTGWHIQTPHAFVNGSQVHMKHWHTKGVSNPHTHHHRMYVPETMQKADMGPMIYFK